jgi:hypothetical protein
MKTRRNHWTLRQFRIRVKDRTICYRPILLGRHLLHDRPVLIVQLGILDPLLSWAENRSILSETFFGFNSYEKRRKTFEDGSSSFAMIDFVRPPAFKITPVKGEQ